MRKLRDAVKGVEYAADPARLDALLAGWTGTRGPNSRSHEKTSSKFQYTYFSPRGIKYKTIKAACGAVLSGDWLDKQKADAASASGDARTNGADALARFLARRAARRDGPRVPRAIRLLPDDEGFAPPQEPRLRRTKLAPLDLARVPIFRRADQNHQRPVLAAPRPPSRTSRAVPSSPQPLPVAQLPVPHLPKKRPRELLDDTSLDEDLESGPEEDPVQCPEKDDQVELVGDGLVASLKGATGRVLGEKRGRIAVELDSGREVRVLPGDLKVVAAAAMAS